MKSDKDHLITLP